jgi:tetratricopeptide (TPR) repeat protein
MNRTILLSLVLALVACSKNPDSGSGPAKPGAFAAIDEQIIKKDYGPALEALEALRAQQGPEPEVVRRLVGIYRIQGDSSRAIVRARESLAAHPQSKSLYIPLAEIYVQVGQLQSARQTLEQARAQNVDDAQVSLNLGSVLGRMGEFDAARAEFERAGKAGVEEKLVIYNKALLLTQQNQMKTARTMFEGLAEKHPDWAPAKRELALAILALDIESPASVDRALDLLMSVKDALPGDWRLYEGMGNAWLAKGDYDASVFAFTEALRYGQNPKSVEARYVVAKRKQLEAQAQAAKEPAPK